MDNAVFGLYLGLIVTATIVSFLSFTVLKSKFLSRKYDDVFWFSFAIFMGWTGTLMIRIWFSFWKHGKIHSYDVSWMEDSIFLCMIIFTLMSGGIMHIRTLTKAKYGEKGWIYSCFLILFSIFLGVATL